jgi:hypothetical protein
VERRRVAVSSFTSSFTAVARSKSSRREFESRRPRQNTNKNDVFREDRAPRAPRSTVVLPLEGLLLDTSCSTSFSQEDAALAKTREKATFR